MIQLKVMILTKKGHHELLSTAANLVHTFIKKCYQELLHVY